MKMLIGLMSLALSFASVASSGETKTFTYDGTQNSVELMLKGEKTHTEYRVENRQTTCFRTEMAGYQTICTGGGYYGGGYPGGYRGPYGGGYGRPYPGPYGGRSCYQQPIYRQVAYPCTQAVRIPFEVKDYDVDAKVLVDVTNVTGAATTGETFNVKLDGDQVTMQAMGSKKFLLVLKKQDLRGRMNGSVKMVDGLFAVELVEAAPVVKALKMTNISMEDSVLSFDMGPIVNRAHLGFSLNVVHKRALASDTQVFDRELTASEVVINTNPTTTAASVNVEKVGVALTDGKYSLTAKAFFKPEGSLLNKADFGDTLETSRTLLYKIR